MTENDIKEALSNNFIQTIASHAGIKSITPHKDHGEDLLLSEMTSRSDNGKTRIFDSGRKLSFQLKATTESGVRFKDNKYSYALEAKTYNDLVIRRSSMLPLFLIIFLLPDDKNDWVLLGEEELIIRKKALWYIPSSEDEQTFNDSTKTIYIPKENLILSDTFTRLFDQAYSLE